MNRFSHGQNVANSDFSQFLRGLVLTWDYLRGGLSGKLHVIHTQQTIQDVNMWAQIPVRLICTNFKTLRRHFENIFCVDLFLRTPKIKIFCMD